MKNSQELKKKRKSELLDPRLNIKNVNYFIIYKKKNKNVKLKDERTKELDKLKFETKSYGKKEELF
jgi:hypothetical protein